MPIKASSLYDKEVYTSTGVYVGVVDDIILDTVQERIVELEVETSEGKKVTLPYNLVNSVKDIILLKPSR